MEKKREKRDLGYFELVTHSSLSSSKASPSYEKKQSGLSWLKPRNVQITTVMIIINMKSQSVSCAVVTLPHVFLPLGGVFPPKVPSF